MELFDVVVSTKERVGKSHWYESVLEDTECMSLAIPDRSVHKDTGRAIKDKDISTKKLCRRIVDRMRQKKRVVIICRDGYSTSGFIALACKCWYDGSSAEDAINAARDQGDFSTARPKEQRAQLTEILKYAKEIDTCPFLKKQKVGE